VFSQSLGLKTATCRQKSKLRHKYLKKNRNLLTDNDDLKKTIKTANVTKQVIDTMVCQLKEFSTSSLQRNDKQARARMKHILQRIISSTLR
jgi:hypothetical protein